MIDFIVFFLIGTSIICAFQSLVADKYTIKNPDGTTIYFWKQDPYFICSAIIVCLVVLIILICFLMSLGLKIIYTFKLKKLKLSKNKIQGHELKCEDW